MGARPPRDSRRGNVVGAAAGGCLCQARQSITATLGSRAVVRPRLDASLTSRTLGQPFQPYATALDPVVRRCHGPVTDFSASDVIFTALAFSTRTDMNVTIKITLTPLSAILIAAVVIAWIIAGIEPG